MEAIIAITLGSALFMFFNEAEDECVRGTFFAKGDFFNSQVSWKNKWKLDENENPIANFERKMIYLKLIAPRFEERFPYSSTILVFLTDGEHLFQFLKLLTLSIMTGLAWRGDFWLGVLLFWAGNILFGTIKESLLKKLMK